MSRTPERHPGPRVQVDLEHATGLVALRSIGVAEPVLPAIEPPDLRVDEATAEHLRRSGWHAAVRVHHPAASTTPLHPGFAQSLRERLDGRHPGVGFAPQFVQVNFRVMDDLDESWRVADAVGQYLAAVVDPSGRSAAELAIRFIDSGRVEL